MLRDGEGHQLGEQVMTFPRRPLRRWALMAVFLACVATGVAGQAGRPGPPDVSCKLAPAVLDVSVPAGALVARIELHSPQAGGVQLSADRISAGVVIASVGPTRLPRPGGKLDGIEEHVQARRVEDLVDTRLGTASPNGVPELVVRFDRPSDGDPATREDGDAGDLLAMLMDVPDGTSVPICLEGRIDDATFTCCDSVVVRNRGLRNLPRGLLTSQ
jgi:hypothetical protein